MKRFNHILRALLLVSALTAQTVLAQADKPEVLVMTAQSGGNNPTGGRAGTKNPASVGVFASTSSIKSPKTCSRGRRTVDELR